MGINRFKMFCKSCQRLPFTADEEDAALKWVHPELDAKINKRSVCPKYLERSKDGE
jgi:hypothetical protein